ncbi:MAG: XRE family transcriptional regulator [Ignavibacteria bacterium]|nr:XRE family transcriptional regulator [Ignavibacteria bacterium]
MTPTTDAYPKHIGERIRSARIDLRLTQDQLAELVQLPRPSISNIESGNRAVDSMELVQIARALKKPISFFLELPIEQIQDEPLTVLYRSDEISETDRSAVDNFISLSKDYSALENLLGLQDSSLLPCWGAPLRSKWEAIVQGEKAASDLRGYLNIGNGPVPDLDNILEQRGIKVVLRPLPDSKVWGFSITSAEFGHAIFVNTNCTRERQLFTLAHEVGHLIMDRGHTATVLTEKEAKDEDTHEQETLAEVRANSFAAAFLMPDVAVKAALLQLGVTGGAQEQISAATIDYLRKQFGASYEAMFWQLVNLRVITKKDRERFLPYAVEDAAPVGGVTSLLLPERYKTLAVEAYRRAKISIGKLADLLRIDIYEARRLVKQFGIQQSPA